MKYTQPQILSTRKATACIQNAQPKSGSFVIDGGTNRSTPPAYPGDE